MSVVASVVSQHSLKFRCNNLVSVTLFLKIFNK